MTRRYDSPVRRRQVEETRERLVAAGAELLAGFPVWDWRALTVRAVAERAGVAERTAYRYFAGERELRDAVMARLEREAGIELDALTLEDVQEAAARILARVARHPIRPRTQPDPTLRATNERQRAALLRAVRPATKGWSARDRTIAAALLDVLWAPVTYERLVADWELDPDDAARAVTWGIELVQQALTDGRRPPARAPRR